MTLMEFAEVERLGGEALWGSYLDYPHEGSWTEAAAVEMWGWVLGRQAPAVAVEVVYQGRVVRRVPITVQRPDVAAVYPHVPNAALSGFQLTLHLLGIPEIDLQVQAVLQ